MRRYYRGTFWNLVRMQGGANQDDGQSWKEDTNERLYEAS